jgi:hypothetical protein
MKKQIGGKLMPAKASVSIIELSISLPDKNNLVCALLVKTQTAEESAFRGQGRACY